MNRRKVLILAVFVILLMFFFVVKELFFDFATSVVPGWHTTIFAPRQITYIIFLIIASVVLLIVLGIIIRKFSKKNED